MDLLKRENSLTCYKKRETNTKMPKRARARAKKGGSEKEMKRLYMIPLVLLLLIQVILVIRLTSPIIHAEINYPVSNYSSTLVPLIVFHFHTS